MRFPSSGISWKQLLKYSSQRLTRILTVPVTNGYRKLRRFLNPNGFATRVMSDLRTESKRIIGGKPQSLADYFSVGNYYVAKKLVLMLVVLMILLPVLYLKFLHPIICTNFLTVTMVVNSAEQMGYTGKVKLLDAEGGRLIYHGDLAEGRVTGDGSLYNAQGELVYQGQFLLEKYEGTGETFWPNGAVKYQGTFANNLYEGQGTVFDAAGSMVYEGAFEAGEYQGEGILYQNGQELYRGGFVAGTFEGEGKQYDPATGTLVYSGGFAAGQYEGEGKLYDGNTGQLRYSGGFSQGAYEGSGVLYDRNTEMPVYTGTFHAGVYDGEGILFDRKQGAMIYQGEFRLGLYHGAGTEYDPNTGFVAAAGQYRYGKLVDPNAVGETNPPEDQPGNRPPQEDDEPAVPNGGFYTGPRTADGYVDVFALVKLDLEEILSMFREEPQSWELDGSDVLIFQNNAEKVGLAIRTDSKNKIVSIDVWNDMPLAGGKTGMSQAQLTEALGAPLSSQKQTMGAERMISVSQSNRFAGRMTNLSPGSNVTQTAYQTKSGVVYGLFSGGKCLILEVHP